MQEWQSCCHAVSLLGPEDLGELTAQWLTAQLGAWRSRALDLERQLMLQLAGVRLEVISSTWQEHHAYTCATQ